MKMRLLLLITLGLICFPSCTKQIRSLLTSIGIVGSESQYISFYRERDLIIVKDCSLNDCSQPKTPIAKVPITNFKSHFKMALYIRKPHRQGMKDIDDNQHYETTKIKKEIAINIKNKLRNLTSFINLRENNDIPEFDLKSQLDLISNLLKKYSYTIKEYKKINLLIGEIINKLINTSTKKTPAIAHNKSSTNDNFSFHLLKSYFHNKNIDQLGIKFVTLPGGTFTMGKEKDSTHEKKVHIVTIKSFQLSETEITMAQWETMMGTTPWENRPYIKQQDNSPAVYISWFAAKNFTARLNNCPLVDLNNVNNTLAVQYICQKELLESGKTVYRLPTEAEYDYAAHDKKNHKGFYYYYLKQDTQYEKYVWYFNNTWAIGNLYAHPVKTKLANGYGLFDLNGNVMEWVEDVWHNNFTGAPTDGSAWLGDNTLCRGIRGGGWNVKKDLIRPDFRTCDYPDDKFSHIGFRLVAETKK